MTSCIFNKDETFTVLISDESVPSEVVTALLFNHAFDFCRSLSDQEVLYVRPALISQYPIRVQKKPDIPNRPASSLNDFSYGLKDLKRLEIYYPENAAEFGQFCVKHIWSSNEEFLGKNVCIVVENMNDLSLDKTISHEDYDNNWNFAPVALLESVFVNMEKWRRTTKDSICLSNLVIHFKILAVEVDKFVKTMCYFTSNVWRLKKTGENLYYLSSKASTFRCEMATDFLLVSENK